MNNRALNKLKRLNGLIPRAILLVIGSLAFLAFPALSQTNVSRPASIPGRYLVVVETSHPMSRRSGNIIKTVATLLLSGMGSQIRQGDSIGVWTYNEQLYAGRLPLQRWSNAEQHSMASAILDFLKRQKYEKQSAFASVRPALEKVVKDSESITIILVSSGEETMAGTPFDDQINQLYKNWREEQQKARMPFVTVLRAKRGTIIGYSVTPSPWQVEFPAWPAEPVAKAASETTPVPAPKIQPSTVPPLIVTGKKPKPVETTNSSGSVATSLDNSTVVTAPPPRPATNLPTESAAPIVSQKPLPNSTPDATVRERKLEHPAETPRQAPEPAPNLPKGPVASNPTSKAETATLAMANSPNASNPAPAATPPPREISTGVAVPRSGLLSTKFVWIAGTAVLGIAGVVLILLSRRPRSQDISLITRSLEREKND